MKKGFTLIELLVVVAIIGVLASVVLASLNSAREKGRNARRLADLKQIQTALELYFDINGHYPARDYSYETSATCGGTPSWCGLVTDLVPYLSALPGDPSNTKTDPYRYYYDSDLGDNNQTYGFMISLEPSSNSTLETSDGGYYPSYYEVGQQPAYCMGKYLGGETHWWNTTPTTDVCEGGN